MKEDINKEENIRREAIKQEIIKKLKEIKINLVDDIYENKDECFRVVGLYDFMHGCKTKHILTSIISNNNYSKIELEKIRCKLNDITANKKDIEVIRFEHSEKSFFYLTSYNRTNMIMKNIKNTFFKFLKRNRKEDAYDIKDKVIKKIQKIDWTEHRELRVRSGIKILELYEYLLKDTTVNNLIAIMSNSDYDEMKLKIINYRLDRVIYYLNSIQSE